MRPDSSMLGISIADSSQVVQQNLKPMKTKEWVTGVSIIFTLSVALYLLFNTRSQ